MKKLLTMIGIIGLSTIISGNVIACNAETMVADKLNIEIDLELTDGSWVISEANIGDEFKITNFDKLEDFYFGVTNNMLGLTVTEQGVIRLDSIKKCQKGSLFLRASNAVVNKIPIKIAGLKG